MKEGVPRFGTPSFFEYARACMYVNFEYRLIDIQGEYPGVIHAKILHFRDPIPFVCMYSQ